jgi:ABC-2 type transport system ATP-binding protein
MNFAVRVNNLRKVYEVHKRRGLFRREKLDVVSVDGVSFDVPMGQALAFIGPNGAGKSTTIRMLTGILRPTSGDARVLGLTPWKDRAKLAHNIGAVFGQRSQLWYHLPASDTFELLARVYNLDAREFKSRRDELIERFNLAEFLDVPVRKLSLGQRMRAEVAASLLHKPRLLLLDEPTIGLDINARQQLRDLIRQWNREEGLTVFLTSHDTGDIESVAERVIVINHGRLVLDDKVENLRRKFAGWSLEDAIAHIYGLEHDADDLQVESHMNEVVA